MDDLDRIQAAEDAQREREEARRSRPNFARVNSEPPKHNITIFGCIKTESGWYRLGFDEATKTMIPLEKV